MNDWVHEHTGWKTFMHSCGSVMALLPDIVEAGFDILNPVQCSAAGMDPATLKQRSATSSPSGAAASTRSDAPFGTPEEIRQQVRDRIATFSPGGGFVFNASTTSRPPSPPKTCWHCSTPCGSGGEGTTAAAAQPKKAAEVLFLARSSVLIPRE